MLKVQISYKLAEPASTGISYWLACQLEYSGTLGRVTPNEKEVSFFEGLPGGLSLDSCGNLSPVFSFP